MSLLSRLSVAAALAAASLAPRAAHAAPDVALRQVVAPAEAMVGHDVTLAVTIENSGTLPLSSYPIAIYLSPDTAISMFDRKLGEVQGPALAVGAKTTVQVTATVPANVPLGVYSFGIVADGLNTLGEQFGTLIDNVKGAQPRTELKAPSPDFVAHRVAWGARAAAGEVIPVQYTISNAGVLDAKAVLSFVLSTNDNVTRSDLTVGSVAVDVTAGTQVEDVAWVKLPAGLAPARYYLGLWIDKSEQVAELNENNNRSISDAAEVVGASLNIETNALPDAIVGLRYVKSLVATGGDGPYNWRLVGGSLPDGLTIAPTGLITGSAGAAGTFTPRFEVQSGSGSAQQTYVLRTYAPTTSLEVATGQLPPAVVDTDYDAPLAAAGGTGPFSWRLAQGSLPVGLSLANGRIQGKATKEETQSFQVEVRDSTGTSARHTLSIRALRKGDLAITQLTLEDAHAQEAFETKIDPVGGAAPFTWELADGRLPRGLALAEDGSGSVTISGKPTESGEFLFDLRLEDSTGQVDRNGYVLRVIAGTVQVLTLSLPDATRGEAYDETLATDAPTPTWRLVSGSLPTGFELTKDGHVRAVTGKVATTAQLRIHAILVEVSDGQGRTGQAGLSIRVNPAPVEAAPAEGCASSPASLLALVAVMALLLRRRAVAVAVGLVAVSGTARAQVAEYYVAQAPEANYPELTSVWIDDVSLAVVTNGTAGASLLTNGDFSDTNDDPASAAGWKIEYGGTVASRSWLSCTYDATTGAASAPALGCLFSLAGSTSAQPQVLQLTQQGPTLAAGDTLEVRYCLKGTVPNQAALVSVVDANGQSLGFSRTLSLAIDQFTCETQTFTASAGGTAKLVLGLADNAAATTVADFGTDLDDGQVNLSLPFSFPMFGTNHQAGKIGTNGMITFSGNADSYQNQSLPNSSAPNGLLAAWWDDLRVPGLPSATNAVPGGMVHWKVSGAAPHRLLEAEWRNIAYTSGFGSSGTPMTFVILAGEDGRLEYHYKDSGSPPTGSFSGTIGVENDDGTLGVMALACQNKCTGTDYPRGQALRFVKQSDLVIPAVSGPAVGYGDLDATFTVSVRNAGSLPATGVTARVYLSADRVLDANDYLLWELGPVDLDRGQQRSFSGPVHLPADVVPGDYFPFAVVDPANTVSEADENNNTRLGEPFRVGAPAPDFTASDVTVSATAADVGTPVTIGARVSNVGNRAGHCPWRVVLSLNDVLSLADRSIASGDVDLDAAEARDLSINVTLPSDLAPGAYRVGVLVDATEPPAVGTPEIDEFNNAARAAQTLTLRGPLAIATTSVPSGTLGGTYSVRLRATGGDGLYLWSLADGTKLPEGLALTAFGDLEGVPAVLGTFSFTVQLMSNQGQTVKKALQLEIVPATYVMSIVTTELPAAIYGREYEAAITVMGGKPPYRFSLRSPIGAGLPPGIALDVNGALSGVPVTGGDFGFSIDVADAQGRAASRDLVLRVLPPGRPVIDARQLPEALLGQRYDAKLAAIGGRQPYAWSLDKVRRLGTGAEASEDLEKVPGLELSADGALTGTPTTLGLYALVVRAADAAGAVDRDTLLLEVRADRGLAILTSEMPIATVDRAYDEPVVAAGGEEGSVKFELVSGASQPLPAGLALTSDGHIQGTPTEPGTRTFVVRASDSAGRSDYRALALEVRSPPAPVKPDSGCATGGASAGALLALLPLLLRRRRALLASGLGATVIGLGLLAGCGEPPPRTLCAGVSCQPGETCDNDDGLCKCGGAAGRACTSEESCNPQTFLCELLDRCRLVSCTRGMTCDPSDGACRCAGIVVCGEGEVCDAQAQACVATDRCANTTCPAGLACDPADGACKCGGVALEPGTRCVDGALQSDVCASVACTGGESCDPADGLCKCGGAGGPVCVYGQTCEPAAKRCTSSNRCAQVRCTGGTSCDPLDGKCKCGGTNGPECTVGQTCDLATFVCVGGNRCFAKTCPANTECDPEDGECHCGSGGPICGSNQSCDATTTPRSCRTLCDPVTQSPCGSGEACTYNAATRTSFCGPEGTKAEGATCSQSTECGRGMHCRSGKCRVYCSNVGGSCLGSNFKCLQIATGLGACAP